MKNAMHGRSVLSAIGMAMAFATGSHAGVVYGDGTLKPACERWVYANASVVGPIISRHDGQSANTATLGYFEGFERAYAYSQGPDEFFGNTEAYADAFQRSNLGFDAIEFLVRGVSSVYGRYGSATSICLLDVWAHFDQETPYYLFRDRPDPSPPFVGISNEQGDAIDLGFTPESTFASGVLAAGWHHIRVDGLFNSTWGVIGVPSPGSAAVVGLGGLIGMRRRRRAVAEF